MNIQDNYTIEQVLSRIQRAREDQLAREIREKCFNRLMSQVDATLNRCERGDENEQAMGRRVAMELICVAEQMLTVSDPYDSY